ncbi:MAG: hypothetical protein PHR26_03850 [Candidatus ainarchaeum sp.]|nr:hypothetical protein [Candidatus ainarchaeum sp.]MDD3975865.1 hypothetical protein [Candidatus ainarchaeum sp.]
MKSYILKNKNLLLYIYLFIFLIIGFFIGFFIFNSIYSIGNSSKVLNNSFQSLETNINSFYFLETNEISKDSYVFIGGKTNLNNFVYLEKDYYNSIIKNNITVENALKKNNNQHKVILVGCHCMKIENGYYFIVGNCDCKISHCDYQQNYICETGNIM